MLASPVGPKTLIEIEDSTKNGHGLYAIDVLNNGLEHLVVGVISRQRANCLKDGGAWLCGEKALKHAPTGRGTKSALFCKVRNIQG